MSGRSRVAVALAVALAAGALVVATEVPTPAAAAQREIVRSSMVATWLDDQDRQHTYLGFGGPEQPNSLLLTRDLPDGRPDLSYGTTEQAGPGSRVVDLPAPAEGVVRRGAVAVSAEGILTTVWAAPECGVSYRMCLNWLARFQPDGTAVGTPVSVEALRIADPLSDGSFVIQVDDWTTQWIAADGTVRYEVEGQHLRAGVKLDVTGRLLLPINLVHSAPFEHFQVQRVAPSGQVDLSTRVDCDLTVETFLVGPAADGGFVSGCHITTVEGTPGSTTFTRFNPDGTVRWTLPRAGGDQVLALHAVVDEHDVIWSLGVSDGLTIERFGSAGSLGLAYWRRVTWGLHGDLSTPLVNTVQLTPSGAVLAVDQRIRTMVFPEDACCPAGAQSPVQRAVSMRLPARPLCDVGDPSFTSVASGVSGSFPTCAGIGDAQPLIGSPAYRVEATVDGAVEDQQRVTPGWFDTTAGFDLDVPHGQVATLTVTATNAEGDGWGRVGTTTLVAPFASITEFVARQHLDLTGTAGSIESIAADVDRLASGAADPADVVEDLLDSGLAANRIRPVARLYRAHFLRDADPQGLAHWTASYAGGTKLGTIAQKFTGSNEFRTRYGRLNDAAFVAQLYRNVFDREPDAGGLAYWTGRLQQRRINRGGVVLQFSESSEYRRTSGPRVEPLAAAWLLLGRVPTSAERTAWAAAADPQRAAVADLLAGEAYAARIG